MNNSVFGELCYQFLENYIIFILKTSISPGYKLFQVSLLEECGFFERALEELHKRESKIVSSYNAILQKFV